MSKKRCAFMHESNWASCMKFKAWSHPEFIHEFRWVASRFSCMETVSRPHVGCNYFLSAAFRTGEGKVVCNNFLSADPSLRNKEFWPLFSFSKFSSPLSLHALNQQQEGQWRGVSTYNYRSMYCRSGNGLEVKGESLCKESDNKVCPVVLCNLKSAMVRCAKSLSSSPEPDESSDSPPTK